jgi:hypothetical protein
MSPVVVAAATVPLARIDAALHRAPAYLRPIYFAVRDEGCVHTLVAQGDGPFSLDGLPDGPVITILGDDLFRSKGPEGFHQASLRSLLARCTCAVIVVGMSEKPYLMAATTAVLRREDVVIIETRAEHEMHWVNACRAARPDGGLLVCQDRTQVLDA